MTNKAEKTAEVIEPILVKNMQLMQYAHQTHACVSRSRLSKEQLEDKRTWAFAAVKIQMQDRVQVLDAQMSQLAEGIVVYVKGTDIKVNFYAVHSLSSATHEEISHRDYLIRWGGIDLKWIIVGKNNGDTLKSEFESDVAAVNYLKDHYKALNL